MKKFIKTALYPLEALIVIAALFAFSPFADAQINNGGGRPVNISANSIGGNATGSTALITSLTMPGCSGATNALIWTTNTGFGCNTISGGGGGGIVGFTRTNAYQIDDDNGVGIPQSIRFAQDSATFPTQNGMVGFNNTDPLNFNIGVTVGTGAQANIMGDGFVSIATDGLGGVSSLNIGSIAFDGNGVAAMYPNGGPFSLGFDPSNAFSDLYLKFNTTPSVGAVGEFVTNTSAATSLTSTTVANTASISLSDGIWTVYGSSIFTAGATTTSTLFQFGISTTSTTLPATPFYTMDTTANAVVRPFMGGPCPTRQITVSGGPITVYLVVKSNFAVSTMSALASISALRVR
jgi:hypothetical protein